MIIIFYLVIFTITIFSFIKLATCFESRTEIHNKGYGENTENVDILLDRTQWANQYIQRRDKTYKYIIGSIMSVFLINIISANQMNPLIFTQCVLVCFLILRSVHIYSEYHGDRYSNFAINRNVKIIRKKLGYKNKVKKLKPNLRKFIII